ncbi:MAG: A/G-specific adenine glycosylase [Rhodoferax sp.]
MRVTLAGSDFATRVVQWQRRHGRNDLPWQGTRDPYRVWLSEIMLQQTQVSTVRAYYLRFIERFADVKALASASLDDVLGLWSGLGYYSRARHLHQCAQQVVAQHQGVFPSDLAALQALPGIGRSTAAAIASLCFGSRVAILDANVKRVVARVTGYDADLAQAANQRSLWQHASDLLPSESLAQAQMPAYTQGMMDLGALLCLPRNPRCSECPVSDFCQAMQAGNPERYPVRSRRLRRSSQSIWWLWVQSECGALCLAKRPTPGIWAGLYCLPLFDSEASLVQAVPEPLHARLCAEPTFTHILTHKDLHLHPWRLSLPDSALPWGQGQWLTAQQWRTLGLPAPIRKLLESRRVSELPCDG